MFKVSISLYGEENRGGGSFLLMSVPALIFAHIGIKEWIGDVGLGEKHLYLVKSAQCWHSALSNAGEWQRRCIGGKLEKGQKTKMINHIFVIYKSRIILVNFLTLHLPPHPSQPCSVHLVLLVLEPAHRIHHLSVKSLQWIIFLFQRANLNVYPGIDYPLPDRWPSIEPSFARLSWDTTWSTVTSHVNAHPYRGADGPAASPSGGRRTQQTEISDRIITTLIALCQFIVLFCRDLFWLC